MKTTKNILLVFTALTMSLSSSALAQSTLPTSTPASATTSSAAETMIKLGLPENVEIKVLIDYVSKKLGWNILYDQSIAQRRVTIISPGKIPQDSLPGLFQSILKMSGLAMVESEQKGWKKRIVPSQVSVVYSPVMRWPHWAQRISPPP